MTGRNSSKILLIICSVGCLLPGCVAENGVEESILREYSVNSVRVFLNVQDTPFIGIPTNIKAITDGVIIADTGQHHIIKVDNDGEKILKFGNRGPGPGEFQSIAGLWPLEDEYLVYDYNSFKFLTFDQNGNLIDEKVFSENPAISGSELAIPITLDVISSDIVLIPTGGRLNSLFAITNLASGDIKYAGSPVNEFTGSYNYREAWEDYSRGKIPGSMLNLVMLGSNSEAIYSFQQTTGVLEKYTYEGEQIWEIELKIPAQRELFEQIARNNVEIGLRNEPRQMFIYSRAMVVRDEGVALLLNMPDGYPLTVAWIPGDGSRIELVIVEGLTISRLGFTEGFTVSHDYQFAWYVNRKNGTIYQFDWPL